LGHATAAAAAAIPWCVDFEVRGGVLSRHTRRGFLSLSLSLSGDFDAVAADWQHLIRNPPPKAPRSVGADGGVDSGTEKEADGSDSLGGNVEGRSRSRSRSSDGREASTADFAALGAQKRKEGRRRAHETRATFFLTVGYAGHAFSGWQDNKEAPLEAAPAALAALPKALPSVAGTLVDALKSLLGGQRVETSKSQTLARALSLSLALSLSYCLFTPSSLCVSPLVSPLFSSSPPDAPPLVGSGSLLYLPL
jgi:hypothetical protein